MQTAQKYVIFFDIESGGIPSKDKLAFYGIPLIEISFVVVDMLKLEIVDKVEITFPYMYFDNLEYSMQAQEVHGITPEMQKSKAVTLKEAHKQIKDLFAEYKNPRLKCTLCGHNSVGFDTPFLKNFFEHMNDNLDNYVLFNVDTMMLAQWAALEQENYKLGTCTNLYGIELVDAHRASTDTEATAKLGIEFIKKLRGEGASVSEGGKKIRYRESFQIEK